MGTCMYIHCSKWTLKIKKNPYGLTWENTMAPKYDRYSNSMQSSSWVQFNIVLSILNADRDKKLLLEFLISSVLVKGPC